MTDVGIIGYGACIPRFRIKVESIATVWGANADNYKNGLQLKEKSVPGHDQDTIKDGEYGSRLRTSTLQQAASGLCRSRPAP